MAQKTAEELDAVAVAVAAFPDGAALHQLVEKLESRFPEHTVQRRLAKLVNDARIGRRGERKGTRYFPLQQMGPAAGQRGASEDYIPISAEAEELKRYVRQHASARTPVAYNRAFLDSYQPNKTYYLSLELRQRLYQIGAATHQGDKPAGTYARQILQRLLIDLSWNSSRLEGNTYSLLETEKLLSRGTNAEGKDAAEAQMLLNHKEAIEFLVEGAGEIAFNRYTVLNLHALLAKNLLSEQSAEGRLRTIPVGISGTIYMPPEMPQLIEECFDQILATAETIEDPIEQSFFVMVHLPYLQPFEDGNKRVSRLAANIPLIKRNLCPLSFVDLPTQVYVDGILGVYEKTNVALLRDTFVWAYERSAARYALVRRTIGEPDRFRQKYHAEIYDVVGDVVRSGMNKSAATQAVQARAVEKIPEAERGRFVEVVETELLNLHLGNIARYRLRPSEFEAWHGQWIQ